MENSQAVQRDGSPEDEGNLSPTETLAREAANMFQNRRFEECIGILTELLQKKEGDPKILHNFAITEYHCDGDPQKLLEKLHKVKSQIEELARAAGDQLEGTSSPSNNTSTLVPKPSGVTGAQQVCMSSNTDGIACMDEYDTSIATLNIAIILYGLQYYEDAMLVLEPLYQNIEPIDETTAFHVCRLLLDIALACHEAVKAADVVQYMEKAFVFGFTPLQVDSGGTLQNQSTSQLVRATSSTSTNVAAVEGTGSATNANATTTPVAAANSESSLTRTLSYDAGAYDALLSTFDNDSQNLEGPSASFSSDLTRFHAERAAPASELKLLSHLNKVRLFLLTRNLKATKREVKLAINIARGMDSSTALLLKAQLEYYRGNYRKAIKLLTTCSSRAEQGMSCMLFNNLGCIHYKLRKYNLAAVYFRKAYQNSASLGAEPSLKLPKFHPGKSQSIMYNSGMLHLMCGNPIVAAQCFQRACYLYYNQPLLWLRLAECCISAQEKGLLKTPISESTFKVDRLNVKVVGDGRWRHVVLPDGSSIPVGDDSKSMSEEGLDNLKSSFTPGEETFFQLGQPVKLSMLFARQCLQLSLWLFSRNDNTASQLVVSGLSNENKEDEDLNKNVNLNSTSTGESKGASNIPQASANDNAKESKGNTGSINPISASVDAYEEMRRKENMLARQAVLADLAYVELCLENPLKALTTAELLLQQPECPRSYIYLARIYAAESLCRLNRPKEAAEHLSVCMEEGNNIDLGFNSSEDGHGWRSAENSEASGDGEDISNLSTTGNLVEPQSISHMTGGQARTALYVNLAAVFAMQGNLQQAHQYATHAVQLTPTSPSAVLSVVYVELLQGKTQEAITNLKQCRQLLASPALVSCSR
uniref:CCR4-NOT transcription complex subunit 10 n=1 Tax=Araucaria cunninghamii TaxID=56994 RepID=A0A0D6R4H5_ARACU